MLHRSLVSLLPCLLLLACGDDSPSVTSESSSSDSTGPDPTTTGVDPTTSDTSGTDTSGTDSTSTTSVDDSSTGPTAECGNGTLEDGEVCDGDDLGGQTCVSAGFDGGGVLGCDDACALVTDECLADEVCGDGFIGATELCDGEDFGGETCISQGFPGGGLLLCTDACSALDTGNCVADEVCGDGWIGENETCDNDNFGGDTCVSLGFAGGGDLACDDACAVVTEGCLDEAVCGDNFIGEGEDCEGAKLNNQSCMSLGLGMGKLGCSDTCEFDTSKCMG